MPYEVPERNDRPAEDRELVKMLKSPARILIIIHVALVVGLLAFLGFGLAKNGLALSIGDPIMLGVLGAFCFMDIVARSIFLFVMTRLARNAYRTGNLPAQLQTQAQSMPMWQNLGEIAPLALYYQQRSIVAAALLEGVAFFGAMIFYMDGSVVGLGAALLLAAWIFASTPTARRIAEWVETQKRIVEEEQQFSAT